MESEARKHAHDEHTGNREGGVGGPRARGRRHIRDPSAEEAWGGAGEGAGGAGGVTQTARDRFSQCVARSLVPCAVPLVPCVVPVQPMRGQIPRTLCSTPSTLCSDGSTNAWPDP